MITTQPLQSTSISAEGQTYFEQLVTNEVNRRYWSRSRAASWLTSVKGITPEFCSEIIKATAK